MIIFNSFNIFYFTFTIEARKEPKLELITVLGKNNNILCIIIILRLVSAFAWPVYFNYNQKSQINKTIVTSQHNPRLKTVQQGYFYY